MRLARALRGGCSSPAAVDVGSLVGGDAGEPRPEAVGAAEGWEPSPGGRQGFLQRVMCVALVAQLDSQVAVEPRPVPHDQRFERAHASQLRAPHELGVLDLEVALDASLGRGLRVRHHYIVAKGSEKVPVRLLSNVQLSSRCQDA